MKSVLIVLGVALLGCGPVEIVSRVSSGDDDGDESSVVIGVGKAVVESRKAQPSTMVELSGALKVEIARGTPSLTVEAQKEILHHIKTEFNGGRLRVWIEGSVTTNEAMRIRYRTPNLRDVVASGATTVEAGSFSGGSVKIKLDGASRIEAKGSVDRLDMNLSGASTATTRFLAAKRVEVHLDGASTAFVAASDVLAGEVNGASTVYYQKRPARLSVQTTGASNVTVDK